MSIAASDIKAGQAFIELYTRDAKLVRGLAAAQRRLRAFSAAVNGAGMKMIGTATLFAAPVALAARTFIGFEDQMLAVQGVTSATEDQFKGLYDQAKMLGRTTSFTAAEVAASMLNLARNGFNPDEIRAATPAVLNLARATGTDLAEAADIASGTLRAFNLQAADSGRVADVLTATANNSAQTLTDLGESMKYVAPIAQEYGLSVEETSKALGVLANMQIKGSMAGTSLRMAMIRLADPKVQKQIAALGVNVLDAAGNLRTDFGTMFLEIGKGMQGMTSGQRLSLLSDLFDQRAMGAAAKLATVDFPALAKAIDNAAGTAEKTAQIMDSKLGGVFRILMSALEGVGNALTEALEPTLMKAGKWITDLLGRLTTWIEDNKDLVVTILKVAAAVGGAGAALVAIGAAVNILAWVFGGLATIGTVIGTVLSTVVGVLAFLLSDVGLVTVAVVALGVHFTRSTDLVGKAMNWLGKKFKQLRDWAVDYFGGVVDAIKAGDLKMAFNLIWTDLQLIAFRGLAALDKMWAETWQGIRLFMVENGLADPILDMIDTIESAWMKLGQSIKDVWDGIIKGFLFVQKAKAKAQLAFYQAQKDEQGSMIVDPQLDQQIADKKQEIADIEEMQKNMRLEGQQVAKENATASARLTNDQNKRRERLKDTSAPGENKALQDKIRQLEDAKVTAQMPTGFTDIVDPAVIAHGLRSAVLGVAGSIAGNVATAAAVAAEAQMTRQQQLVDKIKAAGPATAAAVGKVESKGAFDLSGLRALAAGGVADNAMATVAQNTGKMLKEQQTTNDLLEDNALAFG